MPNIVKTKLGPLKTIKILFYALFSPKNFEEEEENDTAEFNKLTKKEISRIRVLRRAMFFSILLVAISCLSSILVGYILNQLFGSSNQTITTILQVSGGLIILWATLFIRGWDILSYKECTLSERINKWIYRFCYCLGTFLVVLSFVWTK